MDGGEARDRREPLRPAGVDAGALLAQDERIDAAGLRRDGVGSAASGGQAGRVG
jgi:hypothetical protein